MHSPPLKVTQNSACEHTQKGALDCVLLSPLEEEGPFSDTPPGLQIGANNLLHLVKRGLVDPFPDDQLELITM